MIRVAIVDHGLGNLFSVQRACESCGIEARITADCKEIQSSQGVILPGVGAFGDAMATLHRLDLVSPLKDVIASGTPFFGICLGVQLLMSESHEFGIHKGLNIFEGTVERFDKPTEGTRILKVPEICWNQVNPAGSDPEKWKQTPLEATTPGEYMYFVHSFYVKPLLKDVVLSTTTYGHVTYCSSVSKGNVFACQFHPERSGIPGLNVYRTWANIIQKRNNKKEYA